MTPPGKWHLARVGVLTWFVGLMSGWMLFSEPEPATVRVPGARSVEMVCQGYAMRMESAEIPLSGRPPCEISARMVDGGSASGKLRVTLPGTNICRATGETLSCDSSLP